MILPLYTDQIKPQDTCSAKFITIDSRNWAAHGYITAETSVWKYTLYCILYTVQCSLDCNLNCMLHTVYCILYTVYYIQYTLVFQQYWTRTNDSNRLIQQDFGLYKKTLRRQCFTMKIAWNCYLILSSCKVKVICSKLDSLTFSELAKTFFLICFSVL